MMPCNGHVASVHSSIMRCMSTAHTTNMLARPGYRIRKCVRRLAVQGRKSAFDSSACRDDVSRLSPSVCLFFTARIQIAMHILPHDRIRAITHDATTTMEAAAAADGAT